MSERRLSRCRERLEALGASTLDRDSMQLAAISELRGAIGFDRWCWPLGDPETLVPLCGVAEHDYGPRLPRALELEYSGHDVAAMDVVARRATPVGSLSTETSGRADYLDSIAAGDIDYLAFQPTSPIAVRRSGDSAALRFQVHFDLLAGPLHVTHEGWIAELYERRSGHWQIVWEQATAVPNDLDLFVQSIQPPE